MPGIIYGTVVDEPIPVTMVAKDLYRAYIDYGSYSLFDIGLNGDTHTVYIRNVHQDPISRTPIHVELFAPNLMEKMTADVPVHTHGEEDVDNPDGAVTLISETVEVEGLPTDIPGAFEIDVSSLSEIGDAIYASELELPEGVVLLTDPDEMLVRLAEARALPEEEEELPEGEEVEAEEGEEISEEAREEQEEEQSED